MRKGQGRQGIVKAEDCSRGLFFSSALASKDFFLLSDFLKTYYLEVIIWK